MQEFIITFGIAKPHHGMYARLTAADITDARHMALETYGTQWAFLYPLDEAKDMIEEYRLEELAHYSADDDSIDWEFA